MTARPDRVVDAHVHLWDPARTDWYPYLSGKQQIGMDVSGMARRFDASIHAAESAGWNVDKLVNVAAATGRRSIAETLELDQRAEADGQPSAIIGGLPPTDSAAEGISLIDEQMAAARFRGLRLMGVFDGPLPHPDVLRALADRQLVFELMAHPDQLEAAAEGLSEVDDLVVVVEHTGWPRSAADEEHTLWRTGMQALAAIGERVHCKLSGLAMPFGSLAADAFAPWMHGAIDMFGVDRCFFASNFPVDGMFGSYDQLYSTFAELTKELDAAGRSKLFASNAERVYRI